jgi:hypothetical protein
MYSYVYSSYMAYKLYEYSNIIECTYNTGKKIYNIYNWFFDEKTEQQKQIEWIMIDKEILISNTSNM